MRATNLRAARRDKRRGSDDAPEPAAEMRLITYAAAQRNGTERLTGLQHEVLGNFNAPAGEIVVYRDTERGFERTAEVTNAESKPEANGFAEREAALAMLDRHPSQQQDTVAADRTYDSADVTADCRKRGVTPHVAMNITETRDSAIDARTTRHAGYLVSQRIRKRIEECFDWGTGRAADAQDEGGRQSLFAPSMYPLRIPTAAVQLPVTSAPARRSRPISDSLYPLMQGFG